MNRAPGEGEVWSVSRLVLEVKSLLASGLRPLWIEGEVSNYTKSAAGHRYFSLKDDTNQIRCALFKGRARELRFEPADGQKVVALGRVDMFGPRSEFQLLVDQLLPAGVGELELAFRELYEKLKREGLFEPGHKRPLPVFPHRVGVVTSARGAALKDILHVLARRAPHVQVVVADTPVQGAGATAGIVRAIELFNRAANVDLIIVARGGGSLEDLWAFNEEPVVRAVAASMLPTISGVGHEIDTTLTDLAADLRAPTPSAAAELAVGSRDEWNKRIDPACARIRVHVQKSLHIGAARLAECTARYGFRRPEEALRTFEQIVDALAERLARIVPSRLKQAALALSTQAGRPVLEAPLQNLERGRGRVDQASQKLRAAWQPLLASSRERLAHKSGSLDALSPKAVLDRGYAVLLSPAGDVVSSPDSVEVGGALVAVLKGGQLSTRVISKESKTWWP